MGRDYLPGKRGTKRGGITTPRTAQEMQIGYMPRQTPEVRAAWAAMPPLLFGGSDLVEGADRIMRTPEEHQALGVAFKSRSDERA